MHRSRMSSKNCQRSQLERGKSYYNLLYEFLLGYVCFIDRIYFAMLLEMQPFDCELAM